jgi:preprotein translocase subunit SecA
MKFDLGSLPSRIGKALQGLFGSANQRALAQYQPIVKAVNALADWAKGLSPEQVKAAVIELRQQVQGGQKSLDDVLPQMFALTREAATRTLGIRHFDVQLSAAPCCTRARSPRCRPAKARRWSPRCPPR